MKNSVVLFILCLFLSTHAIAHQPVIVGKNMVEIDNPEISRAFYASLLGHPRSYLINSKEDFVLYINLLVPKNTNPSGRYSARIFRIENEKRSRLAEIDGNSIEWIEFFEPFGGDTYLKGPEFRQKVAAGKYEIEVFNKDNTGKYVLAVGEKESFGPKEIANVYVAVPQLKKDFFGTNPLSFLATPFGVVMLIVIGGIIYLVFRAVK